MEGRRVARALRRRRDHRLGQVGDGRPTTSAGTVLDVDTSTPPAHTVKPLIPVVAGIVVPARCCLPTH
jgi:hypothetical protein